MTTKNTETFHWIFSDLQFAQAGSDGSTLPNAVNDILSLGQPIDSVWLLGDIAYGKDSEQLRLLTQVVPAQLARLKAPVYYVMGNHEMDYFRTTQTVHFPLHEYALSDSQWHVAKLDNFYFTETFGKTLVVFTGDHAAKDGSWFTVAGSCLGEAYPYSIGDYKKLSDKIAAHKGAVVIASHYAFPGGQRPNDLVSRLLPLPENVKLHVHGHAHIGDLVWNKDNPWQRKNPIDGASISQFNISALETERSPGSHSALLTLDRNGPKRLRIRCSLEKRWVADYSLTDI